MTPVYFNRVDLGLDWGLEAFVRCSDDDFANGYDEIAEMLKTAGFDFMDSDSVELTAGELYDYYGKLVPKTDAELNETQGFFAKLRK